MSRKLKILAPLILLGAGLAGVGLALALRPKVELEAPVPQPPLVRVQRVVTEPIQFVVRAHGTVEPRSQSSLMLQVSGEVVWMSPSLVAGGFFEAGEALLRIDPADYEVAVESARAAVARGRSEYERAQKELERQKRLAKRSVASDARYDDAVNAERVARASLRESEARLKQAERDLSRTEFRAPYAGRVREESVDLGQFVTRGAQVARIYAVDFAEVRLPVPDAQLRYLNFSSLVRADPGDEPRAEVRLSAEFAGERHSWRGRIVRSEGEIDPRTRMIHVVARVDDPYGRLSAAGAYEGDVPLDRDSIPLAVGLFVEAEILGRKLDRGIALPRGALRDGDRVLIVDPEGRMRFRDIEVLRREREQVIVGAGLESGELVCVSPIQAVVDGMQVRVSDSTPEVSAATEASGSGT